MSSLAQSLVTWAEFLNLPERPEHGQRYELHDGEVVVVCPARPIHIKLQKRIERFLEERAGTLGVITTEFPYRPGINMQYWFADVAYIPQADWDALPPNDYPIYAPPLIIEVLSPSNSPAKLSKQRIVAMSAGTQEFWVVDPDKRTVQVTSINGTASYAAGDAITLPLLNCNPITVEELFAA